MKRAFLLIAGLALLVALGFAQTPAPGVNTDQTNIKGCLGGSADNYTVVEDNTGRIFKITTSSVDLKPHLSHDVNLIGHRASGASSAAAEDTFAVTELNMISQQCAATAAAPAETAATPAADATPPAETAATPAADATPPTETAVPPAVAAPAPVGTVSTPSETATIQPVAAAPPAATTSTVAETAITPAAPAATASTPSETTVAPAARPRKRSETAAAATTHAVTASSSSETVSTPAAAAAAAAPAATSSTSSDPVSTPAATATTPAANSGGWSLWLWIAVAVLVIVIGTMFPFFSRWRKQKGLERTDAPNLSFTRGASSDQGKSDKARTTQSCLEISAE